MAAPDTRPTLLGSCASAASAREAGFRIDAGPRPPRSARIVTLDAESHDLVRPYLAERWPGARFLQYRDDATSDVLVDGALDELILHGPDGPERLVDILADADFTLMVATGGECAPAASAIGMACTLRGIMTAGLILDTSRAADAAVRALRPHARVLLVSRDAADVAELLSAVGG